MNIDNYFIQAQLALASYGDLQPGTLNSADLVKDSVGMSASQASAFASKWNVIDRYSDIANGASATIFQAFSGGPKYLAIRGTDFGLDFVADYFIFNGVPSVLNPQYQSIKTQVQTWLEDGTLSSGFTVTGHSLGGYLAAGLVADFSSSITYAYLYNSPGNNSLVSQIAQALGFSNTPDASRITNIRADAGISPISILGNDFSPPISIHIENQFLSDVSDPPGSLNHSQRVLTDSLALYATFARIDPSASVESITKIIKASSAQNGNTLESTLDALRTLFQQNYQYGQLDYDAVPTMIGDSAAGRNDYHVNLQSLQTWWEASPFSATDLSIQPLAEYSGTQIATLALADTADGQAYRYALYKLNPFAVTGSTALYDGINAHGELNRYNPATGTGNLTDQYLKDRAAMLTWKLQFGINDTQPVGDTFVKPQSGTPFYFEDFTSNAISTKMRIGGGDSVNAVMSRPLGDFNLIVFGSENNDLLTGQGKADRLYGGAGADTLTGNKGNDFLEGGAGNDTYIVNASDGTDTVFDSDGSGVINIGGVEVKGSAGLDPTKWIHTAGSNTWTDQTNGITYSKSVVSGETRLLVHKGDSNVMVKGWSEGELGIMLGTSVQPAANSILTGTENADWLPEDYATGYAFDGQRDYALPGFVKRFEGLGGDDLIQTAMTEDCVYAGTGNDFILSQFGGSDTLFGEEGNDFIHIGDPDPKNDGGAYFAIRVPADNRTYVDGGDGDDTITVTRFYQIMEIEIDTGTAWGFDPANLDTYFSGRSRAAGVFYVGPDTPVFSFTGWARDGVSLAQDAQGQFNLYATFQYPVTEFSAPHPLTQANTQFKPALVYQASMDNDDTTGHTLFGGAGNDMVEGGFGDDYIDGGADNDALDGERGADMVFGGSGDDLVLGGEGDDWLEGGSENDTLYGENGNDMLIGGTGLDFMDGGSGDDRYVFASGDGALINGIADAIEDNEGSNTIEFTSGIAATDISVTWGGGADVILQYGATDYAFVKGGLGWAVANVEFAVGEQKTMIELLSETLLTSVGATGTASNNLLYSGELGGTRNGQGGDDTLLGGAGQDTLYGGADNDYLIGGAGNDTLEGSIGADTYLFNIGDGVDTIYEAYGNYPTYIDVLKFGTGINPGDIKAVRVLGNLELQHVNGTDKVVIVSWFDSYNGNGYFQLDRVEFADGTYWAQSYLTDMFPTIDGTNGNDLLDGSDKNDTLIARSGNDTLTGGKGSDSLMGGDGSDTYKFNLGDGVDTIYEYYGFSYFDVLKLGVGIEPGDITAARVGNNLELKHVNGTDKVIIDRWFTLRNGGYQLDWVEFADGTQWTQTQLTSPYMTVEGTVGSDILTGGEYGETLKGLAGDDTLNGAGGGDTLLGDSGNDTLNGSAWDDTLYGGTGNDFLNGNYGSDTYLFILGDGLDTIKLKYVNNGANYTNVLKFGADISPDDITAMRVGNNLELKHVNGTDKVIIDNWYNSTGEQLDWVEFANGTQWTQAQLTAPFMMLYGTAGNDILNGGEFSETLKGLAGDDTLNGRLGDDTLVGGSGSDTLNGGTGNDTYEFSLGDGMDILNEVDGFSSTDVIKFGTGINPDDITVTREGYNLKLKHVNGTDYVLIEGWFLLSNGGYQFDRVEFVDGAQWTQTQLTTPLLTIEGTVGNDALTGGQYGETLKGLAGDDILNGDGGDDTLVGGTGNDTLNGSSGPTTYMFNLGDGVDEINEAWGFNTIDVIKFGVSISSGDIDVLRNGMDLELKQANGTDKIIINDWFLRASGYYQIDRVEFADGTQWTQTQLTDQFLTLDGTAENDTLNGGEFGEIMKGLLGDDVLNGDGGDDTLIGGTGNDTLNGGDGNDTYVFNLGDGLDTISETYVFSATDELKFGAGIAVADITVWRNDVDLVFANANNQDKVTVKNWFVGSTYQIESIEFSDGRGFALDALMLGTAGVDNITATTTSNIIMGYEGDDILSGGEGGDWLDGGSGIDTIRGDAGDDMLVGGEGNDVYIFGRGLGQDTVNSYDTTAGKLDTVQFDATVAPSEVLVSRLGNDLLLAINGTADTLTIQRYMDNDGASAYTVEQIRFYDGTVWNVDAVKARLNNQAPVLSAALPDQAAAQGGAFSYTVVSSAFTDPDTGDTLTYSATLADGSALPSWLSFNAATRTFSGTPSVIGTTSVRVTARDIGNLTASDIFDINVSVQNLTLNGTSGADTMNGGAGNDALNGLAGNDTLNGNAGNDRLDGGTGSDTLKGGLGDDIYIVDSATDVITESLNEGLDNVQSSVTLTLAANVENLILTGTTSINGTGNTLDNVLIGNSAVNTLTGGAGNDHLDGKGGADKMLGGTGNDTYVVDVSTDVITENANEGTDTVETSVTLTLATHVENLILAGTIAINGTGNALNNILTGNSAANTLSGGTGADTLIGGAGNDTYVVDSALDVITENLNDGTDLVQASVTYTLGANVENLTLTGTTAINGTGNTLDNVLTGNSANNTLNGGAGNDRLDGKAGADKMFGGAGSDTYVVDATTDVITEYASEGVDTVESSKTLTLAANVENLLLTGTSAINGTGNTLDNVLTGNSAINILTGGAGNDRLDGKAGADKLLGGAGDDTYVVDVSTDVITENANEGTDTVETGLTFILGSNVENLTLTGTSAVNGIGNTLSNMLKGNGMVNSLTGAAGNDTLEGMGGADTLTGGTGNDTYILGHDYATDTVVENDATAGNTDVAQFLSGVAADQIWFQKVGNSLETSIIGTSDKLVIKDWYLGTANHVEQFKTTDGAMTLLDSNVQNLVNAMASFAPPPAGQTTLPSNYQDALAGVIAANWQ